MGITTRALTAVVMLACIAVSGCLDEPAPPEANEEDRLPALDLAAALFSQCTGVRSAVVTPSAVYPSVDSSWPDVGPGAASRTVATYLDCDRVRLGSFERPVQVLVETTNNLAVPAACQETSVGLPLWLTYVGFSDAEVAAWFANQTGLAVGVFSGTHTVSPNGQDWAFTDGSNLLLSGDSVGHDEMTTAAISGTDLFAWGSKGLVQVAQTHTHPGTAFPAQIFTGTANAPLLAGSLTQPISGEAIRLGVGATTWEVTHHATADCG